MILGIDLGSTVFKSEVFDGDLRCVGRGQGPVVYGPIEGNRVEMPVPDTESALRQAIRGAVKSAGIRADDLTAVALASQAQTFTVRSAAGQAKWPTFISWRDTRSEEDNAAAELADFADHCSVAICLPCLTVANLAYVQRQAGETLLAEDDAVVWLPTWFVAEWTGRPVVDVNLAAMSGLYSLREKAWWDPALAVCGLRRRNVPDLAPLGAAAGKTANSATGYGLPAGIPVVLAGNDQTAGAYGAGVHESNAVLITLGTAQVVYSCQSTMPEPVPDLIRGPYPGGRFYQLGADDFGAGTVNWARSVLPGCASEADFDRAAASAPRDCHGVRFVADGPAGTGRWTGAESSDATVGDQARAVLVCLTDRLGAMLDRLSVDVRRRSILLGGGGSECEPWRECLKDQLGIEFTRIGAASPPLGAAHMAAQADERPTRR